MDGDDLKLMAVCRCNCYVHSTVVVNSCWLPGLTVPNRRTTIHSKWTELLERVRLLHCCV